MSTAGGKRQGPCAFRQHTPTKCHSLTARRSQAFVRAHLAETALKMFRAACRHREDAAGDRGDRGRRERAPHVGDKRDAGRCAHTLERAAPCSRKRLPLWSITNHSAWYTPGCTGARGSCGCKRAGCGARRRRCARALARRAARCRCRRRRRGARRTAAEAPGAHRRGSRCRAGPALRSATSGRRAARRRRRRASARRGRRRRAAAAGGAPAARCSPMRTSLATCAAWLRFFPLRAEPLATCRVAFWGY